MGLVSLRMRQTETRLALLSRIIASADAHGYKIAFKLPQIDLWDIEDRTDLVKAAKVKEVNTRLKQLAESTGCIYIQHNDNFLFHNGEVNDDLLSIDGLHLSALGTTRLIKNLGLSAVAYGKLGIVKDSISPGSQSSGSVWSGRTNKPTKPKSSGAHTDNSSAPPPHDDERKRTKRLIAESFVPLSSSGNADNYRQSRWNTYRGPTYSGGQTRGSKVTHNSAHGRSPDEDDKRGH